MGLVHETKQTILRALILQAITPCKKIAVQPPETISRTISPSSPMETWFDFQIPSQWRSLCPANFLQCPTIDKRLLSMTQPTVYNVLRTPSHMLAVYSHRDRYTLIEQPTILPSLATPLSQVSQSLDRQTEFMGQIDREWLMASQAMSQSGQPLANCLYRERLHTPGCKPQFINLDANTHFHIFPFIWPLKNTGFRFTPMKWDFVFSRKR